MATEHTKYYVSFMFSGLCRVASASVSLFNHLFILFPAYSGASARVLSNCFPIPFLTLDTYSLGSFATCAADLTNSILEENSWERSCEHATAHFFTEKISFAPSTLARGVPKVL